jgi:DNA invertase Pin-like site-specific DNA recombinase
MFQVIAAMGEFERELIRERVRAGLRNACAKGTKLGRPKRVVDVIRVHALRAKGLGWKRIADEMGVGVGTLYRLVPNGSKIRE